MVKLFSAFGKQLYYFETGAAASVDYFAGNEARYGEGRHAYPHPCDTSVPLSFVLFDIVRGAYFSIGAMLSMCAVLATSASGLLGLTQLSR